MKIEKLAKNKNARRVVIAAVTIVGLKLAYDQMIKQAVNLSVDEVFDTLAKASIEEVLDNLGEAI